MRNLFRSGAVFMIIAGILFMVAAIKGVMYLVTGNGSTTSGGAVAIGLVMLTMGIAVRRKNTK